MASRPKRRCLDSDTNIKILEIQPPFIVTNTPITATTIKNREEKLPEMFCWGSTVHGELGLGGIEDENILVPRELNFNKATEIKQISCGDNFTVVLTNNGQIYSCGNNDLGQLGHDKPRKRLELISSLDAFVFKRIACGANFTLAINEWGHLFSWGCNHDGQLGLNTDLSIEFTPRMVKALGSVVIIQVACGVKHAIALANNGDLYSWGANDEGQLGLGPDVKMEHKPTQITSLAGIPIAFIACGGYHTIVVSKSGAIYAWGRNTFGQLGINNIECNISRPCQLRTVRNAKVRYVSCGEDFSAFLTMDGGVFTCGAGMYGQLGHGSTTNEILPRQVMELMGTVVTQICCGKRHMLALVPSRGRIYAWGLGGGGQLGTRITRTVSTPQVVLGPWVSPNGTTIYKVDTLPLSDYSVNCVVRRIYCGGDHCFVTVTKRDDNIPPDDWRNLDESTQILTLTEKNLSACQRIPTGMTLDDELITYLETVFRHQACINASFLLANDAHYGCSSKHSGIDVDQASRIFGMISDLQNNTIQELIFTSITEGLIPSFVKSPPDVETLRIYVTLPLYHNFPQPTNYKSIQIPFAQALINLKSEARKIVGLWWCKAPIQVFHRLIRTYKAVILVLMKQSRRDNYSLKLTLDMLQFIYKLNQTEIDNGVGRVPYEVFHLPELNDLMDIRTEYMSWLALTHDLNFRDSNSNNSVYFCNYPFLFNAEMKILLLETDQAIQRHSAMTDAAARAITFITNPFLNNDPRQMSQYFMLNVSRENIVADTLRELSEHDSRDLKKPLRVKFHGEEAEDAGGVQKEFLLLLLQEILDPKYGMFKQYEETRTIWFNEDSLEDETMYFLIGTLCGLAIYNFIIINLPFPLALYKKLLHEPVTFSDLKDLSPTLANSLQSILDYNEPDIEEVFGIYFEVTRQVYGEKRIYELIPGGSKIPLTLENKKEFVDLYVNYIFNESVKSQFEAFHKGFHKVCGGRVLELFHSNELMAVIVGNENYDWRELQDNTTYKEGYTKDDPTIEMFWQVFHELELEEKKKFLLFLTGSDRIPIQGMKAIKIFIQPMSDERCLPVAHTCFNLLDLPRYQTRERLRYKLLQAIQQTQGFSLV
ncbi:hypothetical protein PV325_010558 [Microctonus aethiopoides]|nr:hypothetical protein PV325_010558 [Microctonus aethiopoides]